MALKSCCKSSFSDWFWSWCIVWLFCAGGGSNVCGMWRLKAPTALASAPALWLVIVFGADLTQQHV
jgi:hypothetical protein